MSKFYEISPNHENYWRAIILFGRNVASYKFALAKSLYDLKGRSNDLILLDDLAPFFSHHIAEHLKACDKQSTSSSSQFLLACKKFNEGEISSSDLHEITKRKGFNNVIDAFHNVHGAELSQRFFLDERKESGGIRLTDEFYALASQSVFDGLNAETESRWRLVETAWELGLNRRAVQVNYDDFSGVLHTVRGDLKRVNITSSRSALNGYQKGKCFYCYRDITIIAGNENLADVDHFFPHKLKSCSEGKPLDGVANLVLACQECNRGAGGKFDRLPTISLLERLHTRNEYLIDSHHPLRETLILQTGSSEKDRVRFLQEAYDCSKLTIVNTWEPKPMASSLF